MAASESPRTEGPLAGPRAKLARAEEHLNALSTAIEEHLATRPYRTPHEFDAGTGDYVFRLSMERSLPLRLGVIVGDFAHNARSALDHLVYALSGGAHPKTSQFPIGLTEDDFARQARRRLRGVPAAAIAAIDLVQPFHHRTDPSLHPLAALADLSNVDKHRLIHPTYATSADEIPDIDIEFRSGPDDARAEVLYKANLPLDDGAEILRVRLCPAGAEEPEVVVKGGLPVAVAFGARRLQLRELGQVLRAVTEIVERIVGSHVVDALTETPGS